MFTFVGLLSAYVIQVFTAAAFATDISLQARSVAGVGSGLILISATWLLTTVREKPIPTNSSSQRSVPFLATMYAVMKNRPYLNCTCTRAQKLSPTSSG